ncbi:MAG: CDP-diacylglycerol--serine O-phosphatidyltransferase [Gammaproteobacteria bacterium]|nr:CDP-diacylglycerol--serine O-phosphatidyltransferase [Gammaproteobacteria bacterium]
MEQKKRHRGIYLLPNLFTTSALFGGFYAVIASMQGHFSAAAIAVFIAMVLDGLDGRVARMTNTQSDFGAEYDSLSDMVSFGVAPALVMFSWSLSSLGKVGWIAAFIYCVGAALRLARFNTQSGSEDKRYFTGLASPAAAGMVVGFVWICEDNGIAPSAVSWLAVFLTVSAGLLMVSSILYRSFKDLNLKSRVPFVALLIMVLVFVSISLQPPIILFFVFLGYGFSGVVIYLLRIIFKRKRLEQKKNQEEQTEDDIKASDDN